MNLKLNVDAPDETGSAVEKIEDLERRVAWFLDQQAALERWREERYRDDEREMAASIVHEAQELKDDGATRDEAVERFLKRWDEAMTSIGS